MVLFLVPGVGEKQLHGVDAVVGQQLQHFDGVFFIGTQVGNAGFFGQMQQRAHAGQMHFHTNKIFFRRRRGHGHQRLTHAITNFQHHMAVTAKYLHRVNRPLRQFQPHHRPLAIERALLPFG